MNCCSTLSDEKLSRVCHGFVRDPIKIQFSLKICEQRHATPVHPWYWLVPQPLSLLLPRYLSMRLWWLQVRYWFVYLILYGLYQYRIRSGILDCYGRIDCQAVIRKSWCSTVGLQPHLSGAIMPDTVTDLNAHRYSNRTITHNTSTMILPI